MSEHTKGPWVFEELGAQDGDGYVVTEGERVEVVHHGGADSLGLPRDEVLANAHLVAAAPELLEALTQAVKIIREHVPSDALGTDMSGDLSEPHLTYSWPILDEHLHYMDSAIAKAKGITS